MTQRISTFSWRVKDVLDAHQISVYRLAQELTGKVSRNTVYSTAGGEAKRVDLDTLGSILAALRNLTGNASLSVADLLEYTEADPQSSSEEHDLLESGAIDLGNQLAEIETDVSPEEMETWLTMLAGKPA